MGVALLPRLGHWALATAMAMSFWVGAEGAIHTEPQAAQVLPALTLSASVATAGEADMSVQGEATYEEAVLPGYDALADRIETAGVAEMHESILRMVRVAEYGTEWETPGCCMPDATPRCCGHWMMFHTRTQYGVILWDDWVEHMLDGTVHQWDDAPGGHAMSAEPQSILLDDASQEIPVRQISFR